MRILFIIDQMSEAGGTERHLLSLVQGLSLRGLFSTVIVFDRVSDSLLAELEGAGAQVSCLPVGRVYYWNALVQAVRLRRIIRRGCFDIVQTFHQKADTFGALISWIAGSHPIVSSKRDTGQFRTTGYSLLGRLIWRIYDTIVIVADHLALAYARSDGVRFDKFSRIYNGVDVVAFRPPEAAEVGVQRARLGFAPADFVVGMVANFRPEKNHHILFAVVELARRQVPGLRLLLVGGGVGLSAARTSYSADPAVVFTGPQGDVRPCLQAMDVACLVSSTEGFSNALLELMAMGLPVVVTAVGGNPEAVTHGETGLLIPPGDPVALAGALVQLYRNRADARGLGVRARQVVEQKFSLAVMCDSYVALYQGLCGKGDTAAVRDSHV